MGKLVNDYESWKRVNVGKRGIIKNVAHLVILLFLSVLTVMRFVMSITLHMWFPYEQNNDDWLLMSYSLQGYSNTEDNIKLAKNQGYALFLGLIRVTGINVDIAYFIIWLIAAMLSAIAIYGYFRNRYVAFFAYCYVLWNPLAFENWLGTRVYRNSIFAPVMFILLSLLIIYMTALKGMISVKEKSDNSGTSLGMLQMLKYAILCIFTGLFFAFAYDLKEDSIWLVPMFGFVQLLNIVSAVKSNLIVVKKVIVIAICIIPGISAYASVQYIKYTNYVNFGVYALNTRTTGELAGFVNRIYQIQSPDQNAYIWAPVDSIEKAFSVSPTLRKMPDLLEYIEKGGFAMGDIKKHPLTGDFISWQLNYAIDETIGMGDESRVQELFRRINSEIDDAFKSGELKKTDKIIMTGSLVPRTPSEILSLIRPSVDVYVNAIVLTSDYTITHDVNRSVTADTSRSWIGLQALNIDKENPNPIIIRWFTPDDARSVARIAVRFYRLSNIVLLLIFVIMSVCFVLRPLSRSGFEMVGCKIIFCAYLLTVFLFLYAAVYAFFANWYSQYLSNSYVVFFYVAGLISPLLCFGLLFSLGACVSYIIPKLRS